MIKTGGSKLGFQPPNLTPPYLITFLGVQKYGLAIDLGGVVLGGRKGTFWGGVFDVFWGSILGVIKLKKTAKI